MEKGGWRIMQLKISPFHRSKVIPTVGVTTGLTLPSSTCTSVTAVWLTTAAEQPTFLFSDITITAGHSGAERTRTSNDGCHRVYVHAVNIGDSGRERESPRKKE